MNQSILDSDDLYQQWHAITQQEDESINEYYYRFTRLMKDVGFTEELSVITRIVASLLLSTQQLIRFQLAVIWPSITYVIASII